VTWTDAPSSHGRRGSCALRLRSCASRS
jgi:hypothetical protein